MLKKTLIYLGLGPDEEYDSFDDYAPGGGAQATATVGPEPVAAAPAPTVRSVPHPAHQGTSTVRPVAVRPESSGSVRVVPSDNPRSAQPAPRPAQPEVVGISAIRIVDSPTATPHAMAPTAFNDAQAIGDRFKSGQPVIVNLQEVDRDLRRRLVDFASGLCYGVGGKMDRVADQVYLLTPAGVVVSEAETRQALD